MKYYLNYLKKEIFTRIFFHALYITAIAAMPYVIKQMIDNSGQGGTDSVIKWSMLFILCVIVGMGTQYVSQLTAWKVTTKFFRKIRSDLFNAIMLQKPADFFQQDGGAYSSQLINDIEACDEYLVYFCLVIESLISLLVYAVFVWLLDYRVAIMLYLVTGLTMFLPKVTGDRLSEKKNALLDITGIYTSKVLDLIGGYNLVNRQTYPRLSDKHKESLNQLEDKRYAFGAFKTFTNVFNGLVMYMIDITAFITLAYLLYKKSITVGIATATFSYLGSFTWPLRSVIDSLSYIKSVSGVTDRLCRFAQTYEEPQELTIDFQEKISLKDMVFENEGFTLGPLNMTFDKGKKYLLVGESGKGKSTLLNLIFGNIEPSEGQIIFDGQALSYRQLREIIFYSSQFLPVFAEDYQDNVSVFGAYQGGQVLQLPPVHGERVCHSGNCDQLSGGQKQMIKLQRALASDLPILLLDEPCSAMNAEIEDDLTRQILTSDKTIILISHNRKADYWDLFDRVIEL